MIGGACPGYEGYYLSMQSMAEKLSNLHFLGAVPYQHVNDFFQRARLFSNTSTIEGFPNSFLQAWVRGVPVVSFFDPDGLIDKKGLGIRPKDSKAMKQALTELLHDNPLRETMSKACRQFASNYSPPSVAKHYIEALQEKKLLQ